MLLITLYRASGTKSRCTKNKRKNRNFMSLCENYMGNIQKRGGNCRKWHGFPRKRETPVKRLGKVPAILYPHGRGLTICRGWGIVIAHGQCWTRSGIEVVITALTRNQVYQQWYRGFESHPLRQRSRQISTRNLSTSPFAETFFCGIYSVRPCHVESYILALFLG